MNLPPAPLRQFASDNFSGVHERYMASMTRINQGHAPAYGSDPLSRRAVEMFNELCGVDVEVLFCFGGTGANVVALGSLLGPAESVLCTQWSHINVDETGAPERLLGVKLQDVASVDAKVTVADVEQVAGALGNVHHVQPGVVSVTQVTELGTLYSPSEIAALCHAAHAHSMSVHLDGARIANAVAACGGTAEAFRQMTFAAGVDAVSFGGTKNAMLGVEVVLLRRGSASPRAAHLRKQFTQMPSKQRYIAAQCVEALSDGLWIETAAHANAMAMRLYEALADLEQLRLSAPQANSLYPIVPSPARELLQEWSFFWDWDSARGQVRWMTSWDTTTEDVDAFAAGVRAALARL